MEARVTVPDNQTPDPSGGRDISADIGEVNSPAADVLGKKILEIDPARGMVRASFFAGDNFLNRGGRVYGGFIAAMMDGLCGHAVRLTHDAPGTPQVTLELKTSFLAEARPGTLIGQGIVRHRGKSIAFAEAELRAPDGTLVAKASGTFKIGR
jgi:uncharacterized protein (TIGR00369 family)